MASSFVQLDNFIERARAIHGDRYDYKNVSYKRVDDKVEILCSIHGAFLQRVSHHIHRRSGCPKCRGSRCDYELRFLEKAAKVHGDKYDYTTTKIQKSRDKITVICKEHGEFDIFANDHLRGQGCVKCSRRRMSAAKVSNTDEFVRKAVALHGGMYDYSKVQYVLNTDKVIITCPLHGDFAQTPAVHLRGCGCRKCATYGFSPKHPSFFYILRTQSFTGYGITKNHKVRITTHTTNLRDAGLSIEELFIYEVDGSLAQLLEKTINYTYAKKGSIQEISGFARENAPADKFNEIKAFCDSWIKLINSTGHTDETRRRGKNEDTEISKIAQHPSLAYYTKCPWE